MKYERILLGPHSPPWGGGQTMAIGELGKLFKLMPDYFFPQQKKYKNITVIFVNDETHHCYSYMI